MYRSAQSIDPPPSILCKLTVGVDLLTTLLDLYMLIHLIGVLLE